MLVKNAFNRILPISPLSFFFYNVFQSDLFFFKIKTKTKTKTKTKKRCPLMGMSGSASVTCFRFKLLPHINRCSCTSIVSMVSFLIRDFN